MVSYSVNTDTTDTGMTQLVSITEKLKASLESLQASAQRFMAANAGLSIDNYGEAQQQWNQGMIEMQDALHTKASNLGKISQNYTDADLQGAKLLAPR